MTKAAKTGYNATYKYDALGRRVEKNANGTVTKYVYDGAQVLFDTNSTGAVQARYVYGTGIDEVLTMTKGGQTYYYSYDGLGSVSNITNATRTKKDNYSYDVYGRPSGNSTIGNRYMFTGREYDNETGLYYYRARTYSPTMGRFLQRDPAGMVDGTNRYTYGLNAPVNWVDPLGLWVAIGTRPVTVNGRPTGGYHTVTIIHPDNQNTFAYDRRFYRTPTGEWEATLSANPDKKPTRRSPFGTLTATPNHPDDRPANMGKCEKITDPRGRSDTDLINDIFASSGEYQNNLPYDPTPIPGTGYHNSNSYTYGVLESAGISSPPNLPGWEPGADVPIPLHRRERR